MHNRFMYLLGTGLIASSLSLMGCAGHYQQESTGQYFDSGTITLKVKSKLLADDSVKSLPITVKTYKNVVQLSGFVDNEYQKNRAENIARSVPGVNAVQDALLVKQR